MEMLRHGSAERGSAKVLKGKAKNCKGTAVTGQGEMSKGSESPGIAVI